MTQKQMYAFYSAEAARTVGGLVQWLRKDGTPVVCTCVHSAPDYPDYKWPDKECLGPVEKFSKQIGWSAFNEPRQTRILTLPEDWSTAPR